MSLQAFGLSDIGISRPNNEDVWIALPEIGFFALADGMGGHQAGEVAAREAIDHLANSIKQIQTTDTVEWSIELRNAIEKANRWVHQMGQKNEPLKGMGTTLCCLIWTPSAAIYAHVGDSRLYRLRERKLELLTQDHSLLAKWLKVRKESRTPFRYKNVITRAVGTAPKANPEVVISSHLPGDLYFLCTDGLSDALQLEEIEEILNEPTDLATAGQKLIQKAKIKGSYDNITLLIVKDPREENILRQQRDDGSRPEGFEGDASRPGRAAG
jgi:protein phosphatase